MILGFLIGAIEFPVAGSKVGLGNAGGLLLSGVIVSSLVSRLRFFGNTPNAARNILEDLGLVVFIAIVGVNAGAALISQLTGTVALKIFIAGFIVTTVPPILVWAIGYHWMKINPAVLMGGVAGARSHSGPRARRRRKSAARCRGSASRSATPSRGPAHGVRLSGDGLVSITADKEKNVHKKKMARGGPGRRRGRASACAGAGRRHPGAGSGQINRALMHVDDGAESDTFNVDNANSSTRFRFNADGPAGAGLRAGILFEAQFQSNSSSAVSFCRPLDRRGAHRASHGHLPHRGLRNRAPGPGRRRGERRIGVDLSGTSLAHYSASPDIGGAFQHRTGSALSGIRIADTISNQDFASRYDRVLYQTPSFNGFIGEVSWGHKENDIGEIALRYSGKIGALGMLAGAVGYSNAYAPEDAGPGSTDDKVIGGSISWLHPTGFNLTFAHTTRDLPGRDGKFSYFKAGYKTGQHAISIDYGMGDDQAASATKRRCTASATSSCRSPGRKIFAFTSCTPSTGGRSLEDINFFMLGSRVKF